MTWRTLIAGLLLLAAVPAGLASYTSFETGRIEARFPPEGRFVEVGAKRRLHVVDRPGTREDAPAILLLHGASGNQADIVLALGERLAGRFRVIAPDRPGHGWSDRAGGADAASPARQAALVAEALGRLGVSRVVVVGHSWSGAVATALALDHPDRVAGLVLLAPVTHAWRGGIAWYYSPAAIPVLGDVLTATLIFPVARAVLDGAAAAVFAPQAPPPAYVERARIPLAIRPANFRANARDIAGLHAFVSGQSARYAAIGVPTIIVAGDQDTIVWPSVHAQAIAKQIAGAELVMLPGIGHMPHHAAPEIVVAAIERVASRAGLLPDQGRAAGAPAPLEPAAGRF